MNTDFSELALMQENESVLGRTAFVYSTDNMKPLSVIHDEMFAHAFAALDIVKNLGRN